MKTLRDVLAQVELLPVRTIIGTHLDGETVKETVVIEKHEVVRLIRTAIALNEVGTAPARKA